MGLSKEIGGNFLIEGAKDEVASDWMRNTSDICYFSSGRSAILAMIKQIKAQNQKIALPYFTCHSVIEPFTRMGCQVIFYNVPKDLKLIEAELEYFCFKEQPYLFFFHDYFGSIQEDLWFRLFQKFKEEITFVNDQTHSYFSASNLITSHYRLMSFRKWGGISEGGMLMSGERMLTEVEYSQRPETDKRRSLFLKASAMKKAYLSGEKGIQKDSFRALFYESENFFDMEERVYSMLDSAYFEWEELKQSNFSEKRMKNFEVLAKNWSSEWENWGSPIFAQSCNFVPLYFPVLLKSDREKLQGFLAEHSVYAPIIWTKSSHISFSYDDKLYEKLICIPIDQRYDADDMFSILNVLKSYNQLIKDECSGCI